MREPQRALCIPFDTAQPEQSAATPASWVVRGRLTREGSGALAKARVGAFDRYVGKADKLLGEVRIDASGIQNTASSCWRNPS